MATNGVGLVSSSTRPFFHKTSSIELVELVDLYDEATAQ